MIGDASATLTSVLTNGLSSLVPPPLAVLHDLQGNIQTNPPLLTVFLYEVIEDPTAKNRGPLRETSPPDIAVSKPPMALILKYLLTPWSDDRLTDHIILARAMQVLYDNAIFSGPQLVGALAGTDHALKVTLSALNLEERTRVWHAVKKEYRVSLSYEVRVINLASETSTLVRPVSERVVEATVPGAAG